MTVALGSKHDNLRKADRKQSDKQTDRPEIHLSLVDYKNDVGNGYTKTLLCFLQLFIVSNRSDTWYFANNNDRHFSFDADERFLPLYQFADESNRKITHIDHFADHFLTKCVLGEMISRYMVLVANEQKLMMMRPYQIYAVRAIVDCIHQSCGNGYIWHTTGSGKTLTSFKASTLLKDNPDIEKCLFVVDRKDLDRQTREEFNKFQQGCVEENTNTETLVRRLLSSDYADKVIVTTIQKLGLALDSTHKRNYKAKLEPLRHKRVVFIFDECHRSQFGENHQAIKDFFPNAQLFGFTGTPIFDDNASYQQIEDQTASFKTTEDIFQQQLHAYTITHAIEDRNVLRFHIDYYKAEGNAKPKAGETLTQEAVVKAILDKHNAATAGRKFNAVLATASINHAIEYHRLFKEIQAQQQAQDSDFVPLHIACVFSPPAEGNKDVQQIQEDLPQEKADNQDAPDEKKAALKAIMADYNAQYGTNHDINYFDLYYQDVQKRIKDQQYSNHDYAHQHKIDIVIVVDLKEANPAKQYRFDAVVANPPFSYRWEPTEAMGEDFRFKNYGLAPKSAADFAFLLHGFHYLGKQGTMAIVLPHGVLFRGGAEERIRRKLLEDGNIDTVIGLPANLFFSTGIPVCILVLKKCKKPDDVLFINASEHFEKGKRQNRLLPEHIDKIIATYQFRKEEDRYARRVPMEEIATNDYNLNISRYISTAKAEDAIDLQLVNKELVELETKILAGTHQHNEFLKELGLPSLPG